MNAEPRVRRRPAPAILLLVVALLASALGPAAPARAGTRTAGGATPPVRLGVGDLTLLERVQVSERLQELTFATPALSHRTKVRVLLPDGYDPSGRTRYPMLFLLHGGGGSYRDWTEQGDAEAATAGVPVIVVMPDNDKHGNYVDWYNAGTGGPPMWETFIIRQLLPWIDSRYPTVGERHGRAVAGLSMGGGGAMGYATRHPDLFVGAAAFSGAVDTNTIPVQLLTQTSGVGDGAMIGGVFGLRLTQEVRWRGHNPWDLAENLRGLFLQLDTGNGLPGGPGGDLGDPVELAVNQMMTNFHQRLSQLSIPHLWNDYGPGGHNWYYWRRDLRELLPRLMNVFAERRAEPSRFSFRAVEDSYSVWGWDVSIDRPALEFSHLVGADRTGFSLRGSGGAEVTTAPDHEPDQVLAVTVADAAGRRTEAVRADAAGRVRVAVDLGPGNPHQQHTIPALVWMLTHGWTTWPTRTATVEISAVTG